MIVQKRATMASSMLTPMTLGKTTECVAMGTAALSVVVFVVSFMDAVVVSEPTSEQLYGTNTAHDTARNMQFDTVPTHDNDIR